MALFFSRAWFHSDEMARVNQPRSVREMGSPLIIVGPFPRAPGPGRRRH